MDQPNVVQFPATDSLCLEEVPKPIVRPCDWGLMRAVDNLEVQLGTVEAYNRVVLAAGRLRAQIEAGHAKAQYSQYATNPNGV